MSTQVTPASSPIRSASRATIVPSIPQLLLLAAGLLAMYVPTYIALDQNVWNIVGQGHGPIMLALTMWLAWQRWPSLIDAPYASSPLLASLLMAIGLLSYLVGRSQDILMLDAGSQILVFSSLILFYRGLRGLKHMWFPLFFIIFVVPLPGPLVDAITGPLKNAVSVVAEQIMYKAGYPIGRAGVTLTIGPYQLLVADACAGLNSLFALEAIGVFYMSVVQHTNKLRNIMLAIAILPISFISNVIRVIALVLVTYYFGDAVGQGFVHNFAGILLFMVATMLTIGADSFLGLFFKNKKTMPVNG
ncbi:exosortase B [Aquabacterium soli]|uniref:Exosortase B n=1 Tax=Aquabacterium soli TaxID=2493092 RepID=A0A3R8U039_9BURK|nr:exosortase B [Aquabacterium soli]RRR99918.1 exosortase B [Aquabacterium soli]